MTLLAYLAEAFIVRMPDWFIGGLAGYLIGRGSKWGWIGIVLAIFYGMSAAGSFIGEGTPDFLAHALAVIAFALMLWFGLHRAKIAASKVEPPLPSDG
jgi:ABC-type xylose transport system permease subunit